MRHRTQPRRQGGFPLSAAVVTTIVVFAAATVAVAAACSAPPRQPVTDPWCVDTTRRVMLEDWQCTVDRDMDGYADGEFYFPTAGLARPRPGVSLPAQAKLDGTTHRKVYLTVTPVDPEQLRPASRPAPSATSARRTSGPVAPAVPSPRRSR